MFADDLKASAAQKWFGYGRWDAPYWFVGMEPGGTDHYELYTSWEASGGGSLIDAARHETEWNLRVPARLQMHHFEEKPDIQKSTWQPLIHILLGFIAREEDPHLYQRDKLGRVGEDTALIELCSIASKDLSVPSDRTRYEAERIAAISDRLEHNEPQLVVFYGTTYKKKYSAIAGGSFDADGILWRGRTLCALTTHPSRPTRTYAHWRAYGKWLREIADERRTGERRRPNSAISSTELRTQPRENDDLPMRR